MSGTELLELLRRRERERGPLFCYHGENLPVTPQEAIDAALAAGRHIVHVRFGRPDGDGHPAFRGS
jgi:hypothetical protein